MKIFKLTKILAIGIVVGIGLSLSGCDLFGGDEDEGEAPTITGFAVSDATGNEIVMGVNYNLAGVIKDDKGVSSITITITDAAGTKATITPVAGFAGKTEWNLATNSQMITAPVTTMQPGAGTLVIEAADEDGKKATETINITIDIGTPLLEGTITAGSSGHPDLGSSIDLDADAALLAADAADVIDDIDLVYLNVSGVDGLYSPDAAAGVVSWGSWAGLTPPTTTFMKTNLSASEFDEIINEEQVEQLWADGTKSTTNIPCSEGDVFIVETSDDWLAIILIESQVPGSTGTIQIKSLM